MRDIGIQIEPPDEECNDENCPFHGSLPVRGRVLEGIVVSAKMRKSAIVKREYYKYVRKYERYEKRSSKIPAHNPPCINAREGDRVLIMETRPISKTKHFVIIKKLGRG